MKRIIQIIISIGLLILLFSWIDFKQITGVIENLNYIYILIALLIITLDRILMGFKWNLLLRVRGIKISLFKATKVYYISNYLGLFLPPTIGTDLVRAYYVSQRNENTQDVLASIFIERYLGFIGLFFASLIGCIYFIDFIEFSKINDLFFIISALTILGTTSFIISFNYKLIDLFKVFINRFSNKKFFWRVIPKIEKLIDSYIYYKKHKKVLIYVMVLTLAEIFLVVLWSYVIALSLNIGISLTYFAAFIPIVLFLIRLPISLDGFGINEGTYVYFLGLIGVAETLAFSVGLINHFITIAAILPGGVFYAFDKGKVSISDIEKVEDRVVRNKNY